MARTWCIIILLGLVSAAQAGPVIFSAPVTLAKMVYDFFTGGAPALDRDYIPYLIFSGLNPPGIAVAGDPEGDLGAGRGVPSGPTAAVLAQVLGVTQAM